MAKGSPFATFLIIGPACFFLGVLFASFPYDYYVLWANPPPGFPSREYYIDILETHLRFLHASPPVISRILHIVVATGICGVLAKLYKPTEANMLFDGATLVLYICGITVYLANLVKGLRVVTAGVYGIESAMAPEQREAELADELGTLVVGREDSLKVFAASNTILAVILMGILVLQAGQWYAHKKETAELEEMDRVAEEKKVIREKGKGEKGEKKKQ